MLTPKNEPPTILLVDDHHAFRRKLAETLEEFGYLVVERSNGQEAIEAASSRCPEIIVMDLNMPVLDGLTASKLIREMGGQCLNVPILAMSAAGPETREVLLDAGYNDYFSKYEPDRLIAAIVHALQDP